MLDKVESKGYYIVYTGMDKFSFISLWDAYNGLLTPTQQEITDLYFNFDLTLSEIAEQKNISRQAVSDCMKNCKKQLEEYEEKLRFCERISKICLEVSLMTTDVGKWAARFAADHKEYSAEISGLTAIIGKDYSDEADGILSKPDAAVFKNDNTVLNGRKKNVED